MKIFSKIVSLFLMLAGFNSSLSFAETDRLCGPTFGVYQAPKPIIYPSVSSKKIIENLTKENRQQELAWYLHSIGEAKKAQVIETNILKVLSEDEIISEIKPVAEDGHKFEVFVVKFKSGLEGIFKPDSKYWKRVGTINEDLANPHSEVTAYAFDQTLGMNLVPVTVIREVKGMTGSVQVKISTGESINHGDTEPVVTKFLEKIAPKQRAQLKLFDYLIHNMDRNIVDSWNSHNVMTWKSSHTVGGEVAIDHAGAFQAPSNNSIGAFAPGNIYKIIGESDHPKEVATFIKSLKYNLTPEKITQIMKGRHKQLAITECIARRWELIKVYEEKFGIIRK